MSDLGSRIERFSHQRDPSRAAVAAAGSELERHGGILPGAFDPLHAGHVGMWRSAKRLLGYSVEFELSVHNVDKRSLGAARIAHCAGQFQAGMSLWVTKAATFVEKSILFPGATFVVGADTIIRLADPTVLRWALLKLRDAAVASINNAGCRFLVAGRLVSGSFQTLDKLALPMALRSVCDELPEQEFCADISSSKIRGS